MNDMRMPVSAALSQLQRVFAEQMVLAELALREDRVEREALRQAVRTRDFSREPEDIILSRPVFETEFNQYYHLQGNLISFLKMPLKTLEDGDATIEDKIGAYRQLADSVAELRKEYPEACTKLADAIESNPDHILASEKENGIDTRIVKALRDSGKKACELAEAIGSLMRATAITAPEGAVREFA